VKTPSQPDTILQSGNIRTLDDTNPKANSLAIERDRIIAVGTDDEILSMAGPGTEIVDLNGRTVLPGLIDAHFHLETYARKSKQVDCEVQSMRDCLEHVRAQIEGTPPGAWVLGHGWNQNEWGGFGTASDLDRVAPYNPVYLTAKSLHAGWANSAALRLADISPSTPDPPGGYLQRDEKGSPTGILFEDAMQLIVDVIPQPSLQSIAESIALAQESLWQFGITCVHDFDSQRCLDAVKILRQNGRLGLRIHKNIPIDYLESAIHLGLHTGFGDEWIRIGNVKVFMDGALGPRTAAMLEPYESEPHNTGILLLDEDELVEIARQAMDGGFAMAIHAIGDRANHLALRALAAIRRHEMGIGIQPLRHRIEHLQLLHPDDLAQPAQLGIIASMQPIHATSDMDMAIHYWGARVHTAYAWQSQLRSGAILAFGSDAPVEPPNPFLGLHAATTRRRLDGRPGTKGWVPNERLSLQEALVAYTHGPAYASGMEAVLGRLAPNYLADLIVVEVDPFLCEPDKLAELAPVGTMLGGQWAYRGF
jgi:predicted amidohydrolase YtcJ